MGGSSGGGGSSGAISFPAYIETAHSDWVDHTGVDTVASSMVDLMNAAIGSSPWTVQTAYDPDADLTSLLVGPTALQTLVTLLSTGTTLDALISSILDQSRIDDAVTEFAADLDARLIAEVLPRFERGMQDINAVVSSAFVIGRALIEENQDRQTAKFSADLHNKAFSDDAIKVIQLKLEYQKAASHLIAESYRVKIVAKKEENDVGMAIDDSDAKWDMEVFQSGANLLAAPGGGVSSPYKPSTAQSVIGGGMSGAGAGANVSGGSWIGALVGGVLGGASGLLN